LLNGWSPSWLILTGPRRALFNRKKGS